MTQSVQSWLDHAMALVTAMAHGDYDSAGNIAAGLSRADSVYVTCAVASHAADALRWVAELTGEPVEDVVQRVALRMAREPGGAS